MIFYILVFFFAKETCCTKLSNVEFISTVVSKSISNQRCVYFVGSNASIRLHIETALLNSMYSTVVISFDDFLNYKQRSLCHGYIFVCQDFHRLEEFFDKKNFVKYPFKAYRRILIFFEGDADLSRSPILNAVYLKANDVLLIQGIEKTIEENQPSSNQQGMFFKKNEINAENEIAVKSVALEKVIATWRNGTAKFIKDGFLVKPWVPTFKSKYNTSKFEASVTYCPPFVYYNETRGVFDGVEYRIFEEITKQWPKHYKVDTTSANIYDRIVEDVSNGRSDVGFCSLWRITLPLENIEMSVPYSQQCLTFLVPKPNLLPVSTYMFQPLRLSVWIWCSLFFLYMSCVLYLTDRLYARIHLVHVSMDYSQALFSILRIFTLGTIRYPTKNISKIHIILLLWCIYSLLLAIAYSAGFASILTYPRYTKPINTFQEMIDENIHWGSRSIGMKAFFAESRKSVVKQLSRKFILEETKQDQNKRISEHNYGAFVKLLPNKYVTDTEALDDYGKTNLKIIPECIETSHIVFVLGRNSPFVNIFDKYVQALVENGIIEFWYNQNKYRYHLAYSDNFFTSYSADIEFNSKALNLKYMQGALYLLVIGFIIALLIFLGEYVYFNRNYIEEIN